MNGRSTPDPAVLIHGAWQGAWVWDLLKPVIANTAGIASIAVDPPGNGSDDTKSAAASPDGYISYVGNVLEQLGRRPVSLIAYSGRGNVASAVAERFPERFSRIIYVADMMLPSGMAFAYLVAELKGDHPDAAGAAPHLIWSHHRFTRRVQPHAAFAYFFQDCSAADATAAAQRLTPQPECGRSIRARLTSGRFGRAPCLYGEVEADRAVTPAMPTPCAGVGARCRGCLHDDRSCATSVGTASARRPADSVSGGSARRQGACTFNLERAGGRAASGDRG